MFGSLDAESVSLVVGDLAAAQALGSAARTMGLRLVSMQPTPLLRMEPKASGEVEQGHSQRHTPCLHHDRVGLGWRLTD